MTIEEVANDRIQYDGEYDAYYGDFRKSFENFEDALEAEILWLMQEV